MRLLVCGDRNWTDRRTIYRELDHVRTQVQVLIEGDARGADRIAGEWAEERGVPHLRFPADWRRLGRAAGPVRNQQMIDEGRPTVVLAFHDDLPGSKGTKDMVERAVKAGLTVGVVHSEAITESELRALHGDR